MLAFVVDHPAPATIIIITGDRDYAYALSILKLRKYQVILVVPSSSHTSPCLESQASLVIDWNAAALRTRTEVVNSTQPVRQPYLDLDANLITKILRELQEFALDDSDTTLHPYSTSSRSTSRLRRMSVRDPLEPLRHSKNTGSFDSTQEFTHNPASPRKSTSAASDLAPGGLPIPKTPSHSRRASVSTGSTPRSATIVAQSPAVVEQDIPAKDPPLGGRRSSTPDTTDIAGPTKRSLSVLASRDVLESPLHDSRPPSSIIVRLPLEPVQSAGDMPVMGKSTFPPSHKLNGLASPFVATRTPTKLESNPDPCSKQSHAVVKPTSPIVAPPKAPTATVTTCKTPQMRDIPVPEEIEHLACLPVEDDDGNSERSGSIPHRVHTQGGACDATNTPGSNCHFYVASHAMYSPPGGNVGLHLPDTPSSNNVSSPPAIFLGVDSAQFAAFPHASNTPDCSPRGSESVLSSTGFSSPPFTTTASHETDASKRHQTYAKFKPLIHLLLAARECGIARPPRSTIAVDLVQSDSQVYRRAGALKFRDYTAMAEQAGVIELGGQMGDAWIALHPNWFGVDDVPTTHLPPNSVSSPTSDPLEAIQSPSLTGSKMAATFHTPTFASLECRSFESSNALPNSLTDRHDSASRALIPAQFQPLVDVLTHMRAEGFRYTFRSIVGQLLSRDVYTQAGVSGFKEYIHQALEAQVVQVGGAEGHAWIRLHPELRV